MAWWRGELAVSDHWLRAYDRRQERIEFHGVRIRFPIRKRLNEAAQFNRRRLRRSA